MIELDRVNKKYGGFHAIKDITARLAPGQVVVLCGPSGSGKSTLLRMVNRLERASSGRVAVNGQDVNLRGTDINKLRRAIGFVFQQYNLFPHVDARANITLPLRKVLGLTPAEAGVRADAMLGRLNLSHRAQSMPALLSGGEQQRVAIARAMAMQPSVILFDEPTSALDAEMIGEVLTLILELAATGMTMMCATHEMGFAREVADRIWFMDGGRLIADTTPAAFFGGGVADPESAARIRQFLGRFD
ncbi:MAG: amino acid ABC transporter ATP-binding protein [Rhodobacteraceae bacterium]|nr:amino acid ABC transporter ATP-binding protein [Paracoccaceae bacterium]